MAKLTRITSVRIIPRDQTSALALEAIANDVSIALSNRLPSTSNADTSLRLLPHSTSGERYFGTLHKTNKGKGSNGGGTYHLSITILNLLSSSVVDNGCHCLTLRQSKICAEGCNNISNTTLNSPKKHPGGD